MGLDMYLSARLSIFSFNDEGGKQRNAVLAAVGFPDGVRTDEDSHMHIEVEVGYWRKANAIHKWFVDNVQDGVDDCRDHYVTRGQLKKLRGVCQTVLEVAQVADNQPVHNGTTYRPGQEPEQHFDMGRACLNGNDLAEILPTTSGFFFGSTDYDEWYLRDVEETIEILDRVLTLPKDWVFRYQSSW